jgi:hypothetical protein
MCAVSSIATAQSEPCRRILTRTAPDSLSGLIVRSVSVRTEAPVSILGPHSWVTALRRRTETSVVQRQLLFTPGERLDSARVAETLRRLRDQRLYADITLEITRCNGSDSVDLAVSTLDAWTLRPIARVVPPSTVSIGAEDRNLLGSARTVSVTNDQTMDGHGGSVSLSDPWLVGTNLIGSLRFSDVAGAHLLRASARTHELSSYDLWRVDVGGARQSYRASPAIEHPLTASYLVGRVGRLIDSTKFSALVLYAGAQRDQAHVVSVRPSDAGTPQEHFRDFVGADVSLQWRTTRYESVSWFAEGKGFLDIPTGFQADADIAVGEDRVEQAAAARYDAWAGKMWAESGRLLSIDAWTSGYMGRVRGNHVDRLSMAGYFEATRGFWGGRVLLEQLPGVDPDLRMVSIAGNADPSFPAVPGTMRRSARALTANTERSVHLWPFGRASMLDGGAFVAGSYRWDEPENPGQHIGVAVVGARLRLFSANGGFSSTRIDVSYPVAASGPVARRPLFAVSLASLLDAPHLRDDRRRQQ